jgi:hypothetical protein
VISIDTIYIRHCQKYEKEYHVRTCMISWHYKGHFHIEKKQLSHPNTVSALVQLDQNQTAPHCCKFESYSVRGYELFNLRKLSGGSTQGPARV